jgi:hypothetical protein
MRVYGDLIWCILLKLFRQKYNEYLHCMVKTKRDEDKCELAKNHYMTVCPNSWVSFAPCYVRLLHVLGLLHICIFPFSHTHQRPVVMYAFAYLNHYTSAFIFLSVFNFSVCIQFYFISPNL